MWHFKKCSGYVLKAEQIEFADRSPMTCKERKKTRITTRFLSYKTIFQRWGDEDEKAFGEMKMRRKSGILFLTH